MSVVIQKIKKEYSSKFDLISRYYKIILEVNNIHVTDKELALLTFSAINGTISTPPVRDEFLKKYKMPIASMYNISARLQKKGVLIKDGEGKIRIHSSILPDFSNGITIVLNLNINGDTA